MAVWRMADVNVNRAGEGLRLLEDTVRFVLNDSSLCGKLRTARHYLGEISANRRRELIAARDSAGDIGRQAEFEGTVARADLVSLVRTNCKRVQEAFRTLEELAKLPGMDATLNWAKLKEFRFMTYDLEKEIVSRLETVDSRQ